MNSLIQRQKLEVISDMHPTHRKILQSIQILFIWVVITTNVFTKLQWNEPDVLPLARQFFDHGWLPNDWYLNLNKNYQYPFDFVFGFVVYKLGFHVGAEIGRLLIYSFLAIAIFVFWRTIKLPFSLGLICLLIFLNHQSLIAGEWIVGGVETKTIAYAFVFLSLSAYLSKKYLLGFALAGAAISFHVLIGSYALFCLIIAVAFTEAKQLNLGMVKQSWPLFITGFFGLQAIFLQLLPQSNVDTAKAWKIYVEYRHPQHLLPPYWEGYFWIFELIFALIIFLAIFIVRRSNINRFISAYALGSVILFTIGLILHGLGKITLLRFYWFRFPDVMIPFMLPILLALIINDMAIDRSNAISKLKNRNFIIFNWPSAILTIIVISIVTFSIFQFQTHIRNSPESKSEPQVVFEWIASNTPKQAIFLVDPTIPYFYIHGQRSIFCSFKHVPIYPVDIIKWYERVTLCNGNKPLRGIGIDSLGSLQTNFYNLDEKSILQLAENYGVSYYLGRPGQSLDFPRVLTTSSYTLYRIEQK